MTLSKKDFKLGKYKPKIEKTLKKLDKENIVKRIWDKDSTVWKKEKEYDALIKNRLGWLSLPVMMKTACDGINSLVDEVRNEGFTYAILLGMGGSSLCPEVCRETFGIKEGYLKLFVLDSTDPMTIFDYENSIDVDKTLFIVSSKSGTTIEVDSFFRYFFNKVQKRKGIESGKQFIAITDSGTYLETLAKENQFRKIFTNPSDIGGRYSALSYFGLVPAALIGVDIKKLLSNAETMMDDCSTIKKVEKNSGVIIGTIIGELGRKGKGKLTFILSQQIYSFGYWVEQLIAESTGKEGKGIVPIEGELLSKPTSYRKDRLFVYIRVGEEDKQINKRVKALEKKNQMVIKIHLDDVYDLGGLFYLWEFATAVVGVVIRINPFDEPNVKESKDNTGNVLKYFEDEKKFPEQTPEAIKNNLKLYINKKLFKKKLSKKKDLKEWNFDDYIKFFFMQRKQGDYVALMAYIQHNETNEKLLQKIREYIKNKTRLGTTIGYGPRFLHSTGQLHKGGSNEGLFIQITSDDSKDLGIPGMPYSFGILKEAQGIGDYEALVKWKRRVVKINVGSDVEKGLEELYSLLKKAI